MQRCRPVSGRMLPLCFLPTESLPRTVRPEKQGASWAGGARGPPSKCPVVKCEGGRGHAVSRIVVVADDVDVGLCVRFAAAYYVPAGRIAGHSQYLGWVPRAGGWRRTCASPQHAWSISPHAWTDPCCCCCSSCCCCCCRFSRIEEAWLSWLAVLLPPPQTSPPAGLPPS